MGRYNISKDFDFTVVDNTDSQVVIFDVLDENYLFDSNSLSIYNIDELTAGLAKSELFWNDNLIGSNISNSYSSQSIEQSANALMQLLNSKTIFTKAPRPQHDEVDASMLSLCILLTEQCNQSCTYCFEKELFNLSSDIINIETIKKVIDLQVNSKTNKYNIMFFGGEPLLCFDLIRETVEYIRDRFNNEMSVNFTLTTNGTLFTDEIIEYLNNQSFNLIVSLDGDERIHNIQRPLHNGDNGYAKIVKSLEIIRCYDLYDKTTIRATFTKHSLKQLLSQVKSIIALGYYNISIEPAVLGPDNPLALTINDYRAITRCYDEFVSWIVNNKQSLQQLNVFHFSRLGAILKHKIHRQFECSAGNRFIAITPDGEIAPCDVTAGMKKLSIGNTHTGFNDNIRSKWMDDYRHRQDCSQCWVRHFCGGGCRAWALSYNKDINKPYAFSCMYTKILFAYTTRMLSVSK